LQSHRLPGGAESGAGPVTVAGEGTYLHRNGETAKLRSARKGVRAYDGLRIASAAPNAVEGCEGISLASGSSVLESQMAAAPFFVRQTSSDSSVTLFDYDTYWKMLMTMD
jgi:hypothetical protein